MRQPLVAGNWKMNGTRASVAELLEGIEAGMSAVTKAEVAVCAPAIFLQQVQAELDGSAVSWGGQDVSVHESGAYTGEISGPMLNEFGCKYVIIGHSERRTYHGESDELVAEKFEAARRLVSSRSSASARRWKSASRVRPSRWSRRQVDAVIDRCGVAMLGEGVIAYEPVWAIGTGKTATPEQAQEVHAFIRGRIATHNTGVAEGIQILYGGSMKPGNAAELMAKPDIDGGLIGGASLKAADFLGICTAANA